MDYRTARQLVSQFWDSLDAYDRLVEQYHQLHQDPDRAGAQGKSFLSLHFELVDNMREIADRTRECYKQLRDSGYDDRWIDQNRT